MDVLQIVLAIFLILSLDNPNFHPAPPLVLRIAMECISICSTMNTVICNSLDHKRDFDRTTAFVQCNC